MCIRDRCGSIPITTFIDLLRVPLVVDGTAVGTPTGGLCVLVPLSSHTTARTLSEHFVRKPDSPSRQALREPPTATSTTLRNRRASHQSQVGTYLQRGVGVGRGA